MKEVVTLKTKKELDIFMNPTRQAVLRELGRAGEAVTPKYLSDRMKISPSSVQFHIRKLEEIGLVILDHTELIRGIQAKFYRVGDVDVHIAGSETENGEEQEIILENCLMNVYKGYTQVRRQHKEMEAEKKKSYGSVMNGIAFLSEEDAKEMFSMIQEFLEVHDKKQEGTTAWEYGIVAYKMEEDSVH